MSSLPPPPWSDSPSPRRRVNPLAGGAGRFGDEEFRRTDRLRGSPGPRSSAAEAEGMVRGLFDEERIPLLLPRSSHHFAAVSQ